MVYTFDMDVQAVRARYSEAIGAYRDAAADMEASRPAVPPAAFGEGFSEHGMRIAEALEELGVASRSFLHARTRNWEQVLALAAAAAETDAANGDAVGGVMAP